jgi:hypothetical protein
VRLLLSAPRARHVEEDLEDDAELAGTRLESTDIVTKGA